MDEDAYSKLQELFDGKLLTNDGNEFKIHKIILAQRSEYFQAMFCGNNKDKTEFTVLDISGDCLRDILCYIYTGNIRVTEENVTDLLIAADCLLLKDLYLEVKGNLKNNITDANCLKILKIVNDIDDEIHEDCFRSVETRFEWILRSDKDGVADLPFEILEKILRSRSLYVLSERTVWQTIVEWTKRDIERRLSCGPRLLSSLAILEMEKELVAEILQHEIITKNVLMEDLKEVEASNCYIKNLQIFFNLLCKLSFRVSELRDFRIPMNIHMVCYRSDLYVTYDENADLWSKILEFDFRPEKLVTIGHNIYTFETVDVMEVDDEDADIDPFIITCKNFDLRRLDWIPMENCRNRWREHAENFHSPSIIVIDQYIYVLGLTDRMVYDVEIYDTENNRWFHGNPLKEIIAGTAVSIQKKIYVIGCHTDFEGKIMSVFDPVSQQWSSLSSPIIGNRTIYALIEYHQKIYLIGGTRNNDKAEVYDPEKNLWKQLPDIPEPCFAVWAIVLNDQLLVYERRVSEHRKLFRWNFEMETWERVESTSHLQNFLSCSIFCTTNNIEAIKMMTKLNRDGIFRLQKTHLKLNN